MQRFVRPVLSRLLFTLLLFSFIVGGALADQPLSIDQRTNIELRALKGLDFDGWDGKVDVDITLKDKSRITFNEFLKIRLHRMPGYLPQWNVDQDLHFDFDYPLSASSALIVAYSQQEYRNAPSERYVTGSSVSAAFMPPYPIFIDNTSFSEESDNYRINSSDLGVGGRITMENGAEMEGLAGTVFDRRGGVSQEGVKFDLKFNYVADSISWNGSSWLSHFGSGDDHNIRTSVAGIYKFSDEASDRFEADYLSGSRRDIYPGRSENGRRNDQDVSLNNQMNVRASESTLFTWDSRISNRQAVINGGLSDRKDHEFYWRNNLEGKWESSRQFALFGGGVDLQQQEYAGGLTQGRNSRLQFSTGQMSSPLDSTLLETSISRYRFDTPDELDYNDRDELRWRIAVRTGVKVTHSVRIKSGIEVNLNHLVYIHHSRSGENRWTRQFSLFSEIPWRDQPVENFARFAVSAHYTDYDFSPFDLTQSRLFRSFTAVDTLRYYFNNFWGLEISGSGQLNDHGELNWADWIQNVSEKGYSYTFTTLPFRRTNRSDFALGWLMHRRVSRTLQNDGSSSISEDVRSYGPAARSYLMPYPYFRLEFSAILLRVTQKDRPAYHLPDINFTASWTL